MRTVKQLFEWYLGIPTAGPGQGTAWEFIARPPWPEWVSPWLVLVMGVALVVLVIGIYLRESKALPVAATIALMSLRLAAVALVALFLTGLTLSVDRIDLPTAAIMLDTSASMGLQDQYQDARGRAELSALIAEAKLDQPTRLNVAKAVLTRDGGRFLKRLLAPHKLRVYQFSDGPAAIGRREYTNPAEIPSLMALLNSLQPVGERTRPGPAVRAILTDLRGTPPAAIVIFTDGIASTTEADRLSTVAEFARAQGVQIYAIGIGSDEPNRDAELYDVLTDDVAFAEDPVTFSGKIKAFGYKGRSATILLKQKNSLEILATKVFELPDDGAPSTFELVYTPPVAGEFDYVLELVGLPNETNRQNNSQVKHVSVRNEKVRVLLIDSVPRYEFRFLKNLLERDPTVAVTTVLQDADLEYPQEDETAIVRLPVKRSELFEQDVIVFGDVNLNEFSTGVLDNIREFVRTKGGGLILIAGPNHNPLSYRGTPLEVLLPIDLSEAASPPIGVPILKGYQPELTIAATRGTTMFRFAESEEESLKIWTGLPELYWLFESPRLKPGAVAFAVQPSRQGQSGGLPVIVMQRYGAGKVLFHATDEFWRWRFRVGDLYYGRYWIQAIRYLSRSTLLGKDRSAELTADQAVTPRGEPVTLRLRFADEGLAPTKPDGVTVQVERRGGSRRQVTLTRLPQSSTIFEGQLGDAEAGAYHAWVAVPAFSSEAPTTDFRIESPEQELERRRLDREDLSRAANKTFGRYYTFADAERIPADIPTGRPVPLKRQAPILLWNRWEGLALFTLLLGMEWLLRKRFRLL